MFLLRLLALLAALLAGSAHAQDLQPIPVLSARVIDQTGTLAVGDRSSLEAKLAAFEAQAGPQIVVLMVSTTAPEDIASYAQRVGDAWKIGRRDVGDGLLIVVAKDDRRIWVAPAKALEGAVPDLAARQIIQNTISPAFKRGDFSGGLSAGVDQLMARIKGEGLPTPQARQTPADSLFGGAGFQELLIFFFVAIPVISMVLTGIFGRRLGSLLTSGAAGGIGWAFTGSVGIAVAAGVVSLIVVGVLGIGSALNRAGNLRRGRAGPVIWGGGTGGFGGGGGGFGGGGGGFSSGGGGDFGGGGAGGDW